MPFFDTKTAGPMVLEIPPSGEAGVIVGSSWTAGNPRWMTSTGGRGQGQGRQMLILPPDYKGTIPDGYLVMPSDTYEGYALIRSNPQERERGDVAQAVAYAKRIKLYPLSQADNPPPTTYVDAIDVVFDPPFPMTCAIFNRSTACPEPAVVDTRQA